MRVPSLCQEDPLEEGMTAHSSILAWRIPWTEQPGGLQSIGLQSQDMTAVTWHTCTGGGSEPSAGHCSALLGQPSLFLQTGSLGPEQCPQ